jgi:hypothetical protein
MATKKKIVKWIREQVKKLPPDFYEAGIKFYEPVEEKDEKGNKKIVIGEWRKFPMNHCRRAKEAYNREGIKGLNKYFLQYGFKLMKL